MQKSLYSIDSGVHPIAHAILESLPFGVYYCDTSLIVHFINMPYAEYLGVLPEDIIGRKITEFLPNSRAPIVISTGIKEIFSLEKPKLLSKKDDICVNRIPVHDENGQVKGFISHIFFTPQGSASVFRHICQDRAETFVGPKAVDRAHPLQRALANIIGNSAPIRAVIEQAHFFAVTDEPVLIMGDTGVGKELFANLLHLASPRSQQACICVNCAAITKDFIASELFGYAPGAFTGAARAGKIGQIELADGGTLFLDEIGDLPLDVQGALLRVLETKQNKRINATRSEYVNFRLITATNKDLKSMVEAGLFRNDLFYRINALQLYIPPLKERKTDIPDLVQYFFDSQENWHITIHDSAMSCLMAYDWPGNIRELRNAVIYAAVTARTGAIYKEHLPKEILLNTIEALFPDPSLQCESMDFSSGTATYAEHISESSIQGTLTQFEKHAIEIALYQSNCNMTQAAKILGCSRNALYGKIKKYHITR